MSWIVCVLAAAGASDRTLLFSPFNSINSTLHYRPRLREEVVRSFVVSASTASSAKTITAAVAAAIATPVSAAVIVRISATTRRRCGTI